MPHHCYLCGSALDPEKRHLRRKVRTGEWLRRSYPSKKPVSTQFHAGFRVVCGRCARRIDLEECRKDRLMWLEFAAAVIFLAAMVISSVFK